MRKIILMVAVSLDGFIEGPKGEYDWCMTDQDYGLTALLARVDTLLMGRKTFELSESMGPQPGFPKMKEVVVSTTMKQIKAGATLINDQVEQNIVGLKNSEGKDIWLFGGAALASTMMNLGLVDELELAIHPILLGAGKPLFSGLAKRYPLNLLKSQSWPGGMITATYSLRD